MNFFGLALYIIGAIFTGVVLTYPIAFKHGQLFQSKQFGREKPKTAEAEFQQRRYSKISF